MLHKKRLVHVFPSGCSSEVDPYICHHLTIIRVHISYRRRKTLTNVASGDVSESERNQLRLVPCKTSKYMFFDECTVDPLMLSG